jgi:sortase (surface protein transpeptidase)
MAGSSAHVIVSRAARQLAATIVATAGLLNWWSSSNSEPAANYTTRARPPAVVPDTGPTTTTSTAPLQDSASLAARPAAGLANVATHSDRVADLTARRVVQPVRVSIADTDIDGPIVAAGVEDSTGELAVYPDARVVGWYQYGPLPGEPGSAVLAGHLDWKRRPGIFRHLATVAVGSIVTVAFSDGSSKQFHITDRQLVDKDLLAVTNAFSHDGPPVLRLITCGGSFDRTTGHYRSNVVVTATLDR